MPAIHDPRHAVPLFGVQLTEHTVAKNFGVGDYCRQRSAQVVGDIRQELRFQRVPRSQLLDRPLCLIGLVHKRQ